MTDATEDTPPKVRSWNTESGGRVSAISTGMRRPRSNTRERPAVKRGHIVNRPRGDPQLAERHSSADFAALKLE